MLGRAAAVAVAALMLPAGDAVAQDAPSGAIAEIQRRGEVVIGVKNDYAPFGFLDQDLNHAGFDVDVARRLAEDLGVPARLVTVHTASRLQKLEAGEVDIVVATMGDTEKRREVARLIEPNYFSSGFNIMVPKAAGIRDWNELRGRTVCVLSGALGNKIMAQRMGFELRTFSKTGDALRGLREGQCAGYLYDDVAIQADLGAPEWQDYEMPLDSRLVTPWAAAVARRHAGSDLERLVAATIGTMHRDGELLALSERWGQGRTPFLIEQQRLWSARTPDGQPLCLWNDQGVLTPDCRNQQLLTASETGGLLGLSLAFREVTGLNLTLIHDTYDQWLFVRGILTTLVLSALAVAGSLVAAVLGMLVIANSRWLAPVVRACFAFFRMTPPLLQMYLVFFGIGGLVFAQFGFGFSGFLVAALVLSLYAGAAITAALSDVWVLHGRPRLGPKGILALIPEAYGPVMANSVNVAKATGMASLIAVPELIYATTSIVAEAGNPGVMLHLTVLVYFLMVLAIVAGFDRFGQFLQRKAHTQAGLTPAAPAPEPPDVPVAPAPTAQPVRG